MAQSLVEMRNFLCSRQGCDTESKSVSLLEPCPDLVYIANSCVTGLN